MSRQPTNTRSRILNATRTLYSTHGCDATTLDDILTASGVTKGAFYHYFKSKESLCESLIDCVIDDYRQVIDSIDPTLEPIQKLRHLICTLDELNVSGKWVNCRLILRLSADSHDSHQQIQKKIRQFWQWYTGIFTDIIESCRQAKQITSAIPLKQQTRMIMSLMAGAITLERIAADNIGFAEITGIMIQNMQKHPPHADENIF